MNVSILDIIPEVSEAVLMPLMLFFQYANILISSSVFLF